MRSVATQVDNGVLDFEEGCSPASSSTVLVEPSVANGEARAPMDAELAGLAGGDSCQHAASDAPGAPAGVVLPEGGPLADDLAASGNPTEMENANQAEDGGLVVMGSDEKEVLAVPETALHE